MPEQPENSNAPEVLTIAKKVWSCFKRIVDVTFLCGRWSDPDDHRIASTLIL
jgi:hypothetical protein